MLVATLRPPKAWTELSGIDPAFPYRLSWPLHLPEPSSLRQVNHRIEIFQSILSYRS